MEQLEHIAELELNCIYVLKLADGGDGRLGERVRRRSDDVGFLQQIGPLRHLGGDVRWRQRLKVNVVTPAVLILERLAEVLDELFAGRVDAHERQGFVAGDAGHVDDEAATSRHHSWKNGPRHGQHARNVHLHVLHHVLVRLLEVFVRRRVHYARVVHQNPDVSIVAVDGSGKLLEDL